MTTHIIAFIFYTLAMLGVMFVAFAVYKNIVLNQSSTHISKLKIEDMLKLNQRKSLYVINWEDEKFLIASDVDSTTFLAKLEDKKALPQNSIYPEKKETQSEKIGEKLLELKKSSSTSKNVMRNILKEINTKKERY